MNKPKCRYIYNPVQIAECGGPCEQGPEHCDCGELWVTETGGPADEELILTYAFAVAAAVDAMCEPLKPEDYKFAQLAGLRAVLARWGNHPGSPDSSTLQPVPVSERLPRLEDCDAEGRCWLCGKVEGDWRLINPSKSGVPQLKYCFSHWLPAHALPQPS